MASNDDYNTALQHGISNLQTDFTNGARILATNAVSSLLSVLPAACKLSDTGSGLWNHLRRAGKALSAARPSMGSAITSTVLSALASVKKNWDAESGGEDAWLQTQDLRKLESMAKITITNNLAERKSSSENLSKHFRGWIIQKTASTTSASLGSSHHPLKILTLSSSSSLHSCLLDSLRAITTLHIHLRIAESRPRCEGADFAASLLTSFPEPRLTIELAPDSSIAPLAKDVDVVLLGSDRISSGGDVSNKIGSLPAVLLAKHFNPSVQIIVVSETDKIAKPDEKSEHEEEENDIGEVTAAWSGGTRGTLAKDERCHVRNVYFEWVDGRLIDAYVTERGILKLEDVKRFSRQVGELEKSIFGDLDQG